MDAKTKDNLEEDKPNLWRPKDKDQKYKKDTKTYGSQKKG